MIVHSDTRFSLALMEYYNSKEPIVAGKIFELGLKSFGDDADFVEQYLDFLIQLNDDNSKYC